MFLGQVFSYPCNCLVLDLVLLLLMGVLEVAQLYLGEFPVKPQNACGPIGVLSKSQNLHVVVISECGSRGHVRSGSFSGCFAVLPYGVIKY